MQVLAQVLAKPEDLSWKTLHVNFPVWKYTVCELGNILTVSLAQCMFAEWHLHVECSRKQVSSPVTERLGLNGTSYNPKVTYVYE